MSRTRMSSRLTLFSGACSLLAWAGGCLQHPVLVPEPEATQEDDKVIDLIINKDVDVLFVLDNSGSMGEEQGLLAKNFPSFVSVLEEKEVDANYRMAVVTTDMDPKICGLGGSATEGARNGEMSLTSCETRKSQFTAQAPDEPSDYRFNTACNTPCTLGEAELEIQETKLQDDIPGGNTPEKRAWLQRTDGQNNLPEGTDAAKAFQCFAPQGIKGCGLEQPLEALYTAIEKTTDSKSPNYGFFRPKAITAFVIVTDELDCSYNPNVGGKIFDKGAHDGDNNKEFWPAQDDGGLYTANFACLRAGVKCSGSDANYECEAANYDVNHKETDNPDKSVLFPVDKYIKRIQDIEDEKNAQADTVQQDVIVALIGGVQIDPEGDSSEPRYRKASDVAQIHQFGEIDFGCRGNATSEEEEDDMGNTIPADTVAQTAMPPVRLAQFVSHFQDGSDVKETGMYSICSENFSKPLKNIADKIRAQIKPACYQGCVLDDQPEEPGLQPLCVVTERRPGGGDSQLRECLHDDDGYVVDADGNYVIPNEDDSGPADEDSGIDVCYAKLWDTSGITDDDKDNISEECGNNNLEFKLQRRKGFPAPANTTVKATCQLSENPDEECPADDFFAMN